MLGMSLEQPRTEDAVIERWNHLFEVLSAEPRRQLVVTLMDSDPNEWVPLPMAAQSPAVPIDADALALELHHRHLPMLEDGEFIDWTREPFEATRGDRFEELSAVLASLHRNADTLPLQLVEGCYRLEYERDRERERAQESEREW